MIATSYAENILESLSIGMQSRYMQTMRPQLALPSGQTPLSIGTNGKAVMLPEVLQNPMQNFIPTNITAGAGEVGRLIPGETGVVTGGDSTALGKNMMESMGLKRSTKWSGYQAQHVIPAEMANNPVIQKIGMNLDDASNGIFLRTPDQGISPMSRHQGYHSVYNEVVERSLNRMNVNQSADVLLRQVYDLQQNLRYLQQNGLPLYPSQGATVELWERQLGKLSR